MATHPTPEEDDTIRFGYFFDPSCPEDPFDPDAGEPGSGLDDFPAVQRLREGNELFAEFRSACAGHGKRREFLVPLSPVELGLDASNAFPVQRPFAAVLGCADARVPSELLFGQTYNSLFVVRTAGNTLDVAGAGAGSLYYALTHFVNNHEKGGGPEHPTKMRLRLAVVLGHRNCGAVVAAVKEYQKDPWGATLPEGPLSSILRPIFYPALQIAGQAFDEVFGRGAARRPGCETAMTELTVYLNAAWTAHILAQTIQALGGEVSQKVRPCYGVFDVSDFRVRVRPTRGYKYGKSRKANDPILAAPPTTSDELYRLGLDIARNLEKHLSGKKPSCESLPSSFFKDR